MNPNRIEILELPTGKFTWIVRTAESLVYASPAEHDSALDTELDAKLYTTKMHPGVEFEVERHTQLYPSS